MSPRELGRHEMWNNRKVSFALKCSAMRRPSIACPTASQWLACPALLAKIFHFAIYPNQL
jgi:hypothetical protein